MSRQTGHTIADLGFPIFFNPQSAFRNLEGRPHLPEFQVSPEEYFLSLRGSGRGSFESGAALTSMNLTVASPVRGRKLTSRAPSVTLTGRTGRSIVFPGHRKEVQLFDDSNPFDEKFENPASFDVPGGFDKFECKLNRCINFF